METIHGRGYVYAIEYHIVWCVKYRHKVLTEPLEKRLHVLLDKYASENGFKIEEYNTDLDHVHILISASPQVYIPNIVKGMKGVSAREMFKSFPRLKDKLWGGHLWNPSYFVATVSDHTEEQIRQYIQEQKER
jgi:putative transposase